MKEKAVVAIDRCISYSAEDIRQSLLRICSSAGFPDVAGKRVLLKPNILSDSNPSDCITTNPEIVRQTIRLCHEKGAIEIFVGDSPGMQGSNFKPVKSGICDVCREEGAQWVDFTANPVQRDIQYTKQKMPLARILGNVDVIIGLCKMKTHQLMYTTGSVKNFFGTVPGLHKSECHLRFQDRESFARLVIGIHETVKPDFSIMDAVVAMEGPGPANGKPRAVGLLLGSSNDFALDTAQAIIMGCNPSDIPIIKEADKLNLAPREIEYPMLNAADCVVKDFVRIPYRKRTQFFSKLIIPFFTRSIGRRKQKKEPGPVFNPTKCIQCMRCVRICPAHALTFSQEETCIVADYSKCIRCYCCHEMCPADAITVAEG